MKNLPLETKLRMAGWIAFTFVVAVAGVSLTGSVAGAVAVTGLVAAGGVVIPWLRQ